MVRRGRKSGDVGPDPGAGRSVSGGERDASGGDLPPPSRWRLVPLGCLMTAAGFFSGAMIAVLIAKIRGGFTHCQPVSAELPACDWQNFAGVGGVLGAVTLPFLVLWRLRTPRRVRREYNESGMDL